MDSNNLTTLELNILESSADKLSNDALLEIFGYLNKGALIQSSKVCQRWHNLILSSKVLTQRLTLFFKTDSYVYPLDVYEEKFNDLLEKSKEFPYRNFNIRTFEPQSMEIWNEIQDKFFEVIKDSLRLEFSYLPKSVKLNALQMSASTLTHLCLKFGSDRDVIFDLPIELPNLLSLELYDHSIPRSLVAPKLKELEYGGPRRYLEANSENFTEFLCRFENLKKLKTHTVPGIDENLIKFQLETLQLFTNGLDFETLKIFLMTQKKSLKRLKLNNEEFQDCRDIFNFLSHLTKLEDFNLYFRLRDDYRLCLDETADVNYSVKKLNLSISYGKSNYYISILKKFSGVEILNISYMERLEMIFEKVDLSNLKELSLSIQDDNSFNSLKFAQIKLEKLTKLSISSIQTSKEVKNLVKITSFCPNLKILNIRSMDYVYRKMEQFKKFYLQALFKFSPNLDDFVIESCPYLHSAFMFNIMTIKSNLRRLKVGVYDNERVPVMLNKLGKAKFLCEFHDYEVVGMQPVEWNINEYKSW